MLLLGIVLEGKPNLIAESYKTDLDIWSQFLEIEKPILYPNKYGNGVFD